MVDPKQGLDTCEEALADFTSVQDQYIYDMDNKQMPPSRGDLKTNRKNKERMKREFKNVIQECDIQ